MKFASYICWLVLSVQVLGAPLSIIDLGELVELECPVKTRGLNFSVATITWFKDGRRFYKFDPSKSNFAFVRDIDGVRIHDDPFFNGTLLVIGPVSATSAGFYRCVAELFTPHISGFRISVHVDTMLSFFKPSRYFSL